MSSRSSPYRTRIVIAVLIAMRVYALVVVAADAQKLAAVLQNIRWELLPIILASTVFNYALRFTCSNAWNLI